MDNMTKEQKKTAFTLALSYALQKQGYGTRTKLSLYIKKSTGYVSELAGGIKRGAEETRRAIAEYFGFDYDEFLLLGEWILKGKDPDSWPRPLPSLDRDFSSRIAFSSPSGPLDQENFISVRKASVKLADDGTFVYEEGFKGIYSFRVEWLANLCDPVNAVLFIVDGISMEPTLKDRDTVLVDRGAVYLHSDRIYAIAINETISFKRLGIKVSGEKVSREVELITDNLDKIKYPNEVVDRDKISVVGQVVWRGGMV